LDDKTGTYIQEGAMKLVVNANDQLTLVHGMVCVPEAQKNWRPLLVLISSNFRAESQTVGIGYRKGLTKFEIKTCD
jgi:hypothetical protein